MRHSINDAELQSLRDDSLAYTKKISNAIEDTEEVVAMLKAQNLTGARGEACQAALRSVGDALDVIKSKTQKVVDFMNDKLDVSKKMEANTGAFDAARAKAQNSALRK